MADNSLVNLGELSKPATVFIEKVSCLVGGIVKPYQMVRVAKAEAQVKRIRAESEGEGRGSTFTVVLPVAGPGEPPAAPAGGPPS